MQNHQLSSSSQPWLTDAAITFLAQFLAGQPTAKVLEFGSGGSTIWFAQRTSNLVSVEHNPHWFAQVDAILAALNLTPTRHLLMPPAYYQLGAQWPAASFDLILVDAIERQNCVKHSLHLLKPGGVLMLDNCERPQYQPIYQQLSAWVLTKTVQELPDGTAHYTDWWIKPH